MRYAQLLCLIWFLLEVHFQTGNVLPHTQSLGMKLSISFIIILLPRSDIIILCECFGIHSTLVPHCYTAQIPNLYLTNTTHNNTGH